MPEENTEMRSKTLFHLSACTIIAALAAVTAAVQPLPAQTPASLNQAGVGMGHLHVLVSESDYDAHRNAWIEGLGARPEKLGPLEVLLLPGVTIVIKKGESAGGSEGTTVNHLGFLVQDLKARVKHWEGLGLKVDEVRPSPIQAFLRFPGNIKVELSEDPTITTPVAHHHIHLYTTEVDAMKKWYVEKFGGAPGKRGRFEEAWFPGVRISIAPADDKPAGTKGRAVDHIGFEIDGLEAFCKKLEAQGVKFDIPYKTVPAIKLSIAFLTDPWGTYIELTEGLDALR